MRSRKGDLQRLNNEVDMGQDPETLVELNPVELNHMDCRQPYFVFGLLARCREGFHDCMNSKTEYTVSKTMIYIYINS